MVMHSLDSTPCRHSAFRRRRQPRMFSIRPIRHHGFRLPSAVLRITTMVTRTTTANRCTTRAPWALSAFSRCSSSASSPWRFMLWDCPLREMKALRCAMRPDRPLPGKCQSPGFIAKEISICR